jgi:hypothetical protein
VSQFETVKTAICSDECCAPPPLVLPVTPVSTFVCRVNILVMLGEEAALEKVSGL